MAALEFRAAPPVRRVVLSETVGHKLEALVFSRQPGGLPTMEPPPCPTAAATSAEVVALRPATEPADIDDARALFGAYAESLAIDLGFQNFAEELATLPGAYAPPRGLLLVAYVDGAPAGCGAFRPIDDCDYPNACEMKRLYVRPAFRGFGLGRQIAEALMDGARRAGYGTILLDTLDEMEAARELYASLGFESISPYYFNPLSGAHYLKADLD